MKLFHKFVKFSMRDGTATWSITYERVGGKWMWNFQLGKLLFSYEQLSSVVHAYNAFCESNSRMSISIGELEPLEKIVSPLVSHNSKIVFAPFGDDGYGYILTAFTGAKENLILLIDQDDAQSWASIRRLILEHNNLHGYTI